MTGDADDFLDYLKVVHVHIRGSDSSSAAVYQAGQVSRLNDSAAGISDEERAQDLVPRVRTEPRPTRRLQVDFRVFPLGGSLRAIEHYLEHGRCIAVTVKALGYIR